VPRSSKSTDANEWIFFVGAGISRDSGCPTFAPFWSAFVSAAFQESESAVAIEARQDSVLNGIQLMNVIPPEQLFYRMQKTDDRNRSSIIKTLSLDPPRNSELAFIGVIGGNRCIEAAR
jgi:hypothetical protein